MWEETRVATEEKTNWQWSGGDVVVCAAGLIIDQQYPTGQIASLKVCTASDAARHSSSPGERDGCALSLFVSLVGDVGERIRKRSRIVMSSCQAKRRTMSAMMVRTGQR